MKFKKYAFHWFLILALLGLTTVESMAHGWTAPKEAHEVTNPIVLDAESARKGQQSYLENCAACHGANIEGLKARETGLETDTPSLKDRLKIHTDGDFFWKINEGKGAMPSFKDDLSDEQKWHIINYIRQESE